MMDHEIIARTCHEANRAYCKALGDDSQLPWEKAPEWQRASARAGVDFHWMYKQSTPRDSHTSWLANKQMDGWKYGAVKDPEKKEHPCMVPFEDLPPEQQAKDFIFHAICRTLLEYT